MLENSNKLTKKDLFSTLKPGDLVNIADFTTSNFILHYTNEQIKKLVNTTYAVRFSRKQIKADEQVMFLGETIEIRRTSEKLASICPVKLFKENTNQCFYLTKVLLNTGEAVYIDVSYLQ